MATPSLVADFTLPAALEAAAPAEARGLRRDGVRLLVSTIAADAVSHHRFHELPRLLTPGDLLVVNTSGTLNASLGASNDAGDDLELHLSTQVPGGFWVVEVRGRRDQGSVPYRRPLSGTTIHLPAGAEAELLAPYPLTATGRSSRLWLAALTLPAPLAAYLDRYGAPIRYGYVKTSWPKTMYQTVFATEPGSAEMPSAARPFTTELVTALVSRGIQIAPLLLHTGVSSLDDHEPPYEEYFRVPRDTADRINATRSNGGRVIAVGTTVVRALESVTDDHARTAAGEGWTNVVISPDRPVRAIDGLITGLHAPKASHLMMLEQIVAAISARRAIRDDRTTHLARAYDVAVAAEYLWHEFGDAHLIV
jgi:S-adenosylmethionine:tRNA ribosyltransferase-isomerase